jgi:putative nucleotidyltransferase with HDIG domain
MLRTRVKAGPITGLVMSLLFAVALTGVHSFDRYVTAWTPQFGKPTATTIRVPYGPRLVKDQKTNRSEIRYERTRVLVPRGTVLEKKNEGDIIAVAFETARRPPQTPRLLAMFAIFFTLTLGLLTYLRRFGHSRFRLLRVQGGILVLMGSLALIAKAMFLFTSLSEYWVPLAAVPLWVATSFDRRTAFVVNVVLAFSVASFLEFDLLLLCLLLARGMAATLLYLDRKHARQMVLSGAAAGACAVALFVAIMVTFEGRYDWLTDLGRLGESQLIACVGGGVFAGVLGAFFRSPSEKLLGNIPRDRLLDLSDLEQPLLMRLAHEAPGTYEHSRAMANLAEQAASAIGADALITRVGAYYHDLGKTTQPKYFVENLSPDDRSPHDDLDPEVSADAIMAHVVLGAKILREGGIPEPVVEFAYTHHGTQLVEYFWMRCLQQGNPKGLDPSAFRYPGMKPQTKETAIVMLVDSIEAASRTIDPPERDSFESMILRIVFTKIKDGQLDDSGLEMSDLSVIMNRMADTLVNMHHHRIKYQWQAKRAQEFGVPSTAVSSPIATTALATERPPPSSPELMVEDVFPVPPVTESPPDMVGPPPMTRRSGPPPHPSRRPPPAATPTLPAGPQSATESPGLRPRTESGPNPRQVGTQRK